MNLIVFPFFLAAVCLLPAYCEALDPDEILVLANRNAARSVGLARYYMEKRGIPEDNLLQLWITDNERCSREDYEKKVAVPVRRYLKNKDPERHIRCLAIMYGLPLKVAMPEVLSGEMQELKRLEKRQDQLKDQLKDLKIHEEKQIKNLKSELESIKKRISFLNKNDQGASLDSEIALVLEEGYSLSKWIPNPFFVGYGDRWQERRHDVLMVSRLDGPLDNIVRRIINESISTEKKGLNGTAYFDARWPAPKEEQVKNDKTDYEFYDRSIYKAAEQIEKSRIMPVVLNKKKELFQPDECPGAALYCGWYSLARYVDAFEWRPGSVGYHIASSEWSTLKRKGSRVWCKMMLEKGVAATVGPVSEPYVQAFPIPELFFGFLIDGYWTLAECYALSQPFWSWQMVLIGDPLYRPFKKSRIE